MTDNFSDKDDAVFIFNQKKVPVFQNKIYNTYAEALTASVGTVELVQSKTSGFIFNKAFDPSLMNYDENYQNEQSNSFFFQEYLKSVLDLLKGFKIADKKIVEIGCGKGVFFKMMQDSGMNCRGFDPTYEGDDNNIVKEYFTKENNSINADVIIMRHTLEHIPNPFSFIHEIAEANNYKGMLYVEVPTFDWILNRKAFWDIFYEHCNYFTQDSLSVMFDEAQTGALFEGQYIYIWANLSKLRSTISQQEFIKQKGLIFNETLEKYDALLSNNKATAIWGAGAKGSTFLNLLDPQRKRVNYVIDINPVKQYKYIAGTGHEIFPPHILEKHPVENVIVMNDNYLQEIEQIIDNKEIKIQTL